MTTNNFFKTQEGLAVLTFGQGNAKLNKKIATFSLPSGFTCPGALQCLAFSNRKSGTITDGKQVAFRCFSASQEASFPSVRKSRWANFEKLSSLNKDEMMQIINASLPLNDVIRLHVAGDFFSQDYFDAWLEVAKLNPSRIFYAYTKSLAFWILRKNEIPNNFKLNASFGGKSDNLITSNGLKYAKVVFSVEEADSLDLEIDHDDSHAFLQEKSFALLLHGTQPKNMLSSKALYALRALGLGGYRKVKFG